MSEGGQKQTDARLMAHVRKLRMRSESLDRTCRHIVEAALVAVMVAVAGFYIAPYLAIRDARFFPYTRVSVHEHNQDIMRLAQRQIDARDNAIDRLHDIWRSRADLGGCLWYAIDNMVNSHIYDVSQIDGGGETWLIGPTDSLAKTFDYAETFRASNESRITDPNGVFYSGLVLEHKSGWLVGHSGEIRRVLDGKPIRLPTKYTQSFGVIEQMSQSSDDVFWLSGRAYFAKLARRDIGDDPRSEDIRESWVLTRYALFQPKGAVRSGEQDGRNLRLEPAKLGVESVEIFNIEDRGKNKEIRLQYGIDEEPSSYGAWLVARWEAGRDEGEIERNMNGDPSFGEYKNYAVGIKEGFKDYDMHLRDGNLVRYREYYSGIDFAEDGSRGWVIGTRGALLYVRIVPKLKAGAQRTSSSPKNDESGTAGWDQDWGEEWYQVRGAVARQSGSNLGLQRQQENSIVDWEFGHGAAVPINKAAQGVDQDKSLRLVVITTGDNPGLLVVRPDENSQQQTRSMNVDINMVSDNFGKVVSLDHVYYEPGKQNVFCSW